MPLARGVDELVSVMQNLINLVVNVNSAVDKKKAFAKALGIVGGALTELLGGGATLAEFSAMVAYAGAPQQG